MTEIDYQISVKLGNEFKHMRDINTDWTQDVLTFVLKWLRKAPPEFWTKPASSTGVNHPKTSGGAGGNIVHTKSAFWIADTLCDVWMFAGVIDKLRICILAAVLLHDFHKFTDSLGSHGITAADLLGSDDSQPYIKLICHGVRYHMGRWTDGAIGWGGQTTDFAQVAHIVHIADMLSSRRWLEYNPAGHSD